MDREATTDVAVVTGMGPRRPPSRFRSRVPVAYTTAPEFMNRRDLNREWFTRWNSPPAMPSGVPSPSPRTT